LKLRPIHVVHGTIVLAVLACLGFGVAFLADAAGTNRAYDALAAHHQVIKPHLDYCSHSFSRQAGPHQSWYTCNVTYELGEEESVEAR
jgi:hypothetical protein